MLYPRLWTSFTLFDAHLKDLIVRAPGTISGSSVFQGEPVFQRQNLARAETRGGELELQAWPVERMRVTFSLFSIRGENKKTGEPMRRIPPTTGHAGLRWFLESRRGWLDLMTDFADRQDRLSPGDMDDTRIPDGGTPGYFLVSLGAGFVAPGGWEANFVLHNLGDVDYRLHGSGVNGPGRSLRFSLIRRFAWRE
jgi:outer membrane receptor protein involved in Fe transport